MLSSRLLTDPRVHLTLAINGYDDGGSTGAVRVFLGDALGPSDYRKNGSRMASMGGTCSRALVRLLDSRLPAGTSPEEAAAALTALVEGRDHRLVTVASGLTSAERQRLAARLERFLAEWRASGRSFPFGDCALGNLVFAGCYLGQRRAFNAALDDYAGLLNLRPGLVENVTDGTNAHLVALDDRGQVLGTEEEIVTVRRPTRIVDLFLIDGPLDAVACRELAARGPTGAREALETRTVPLRLNERLGRRIDHADVIVYAPGTQHSSLYPSYLTPGLSDRIARNVRATKLLITNLEPDAEIVSENAVSLVERALYYLTDKHRHPRPAPSLITHYLLNDPGRQPADRRLVPLGQVETFEDARLVRIGAYEDGVTGRHDAAKVLEPFLRGRLDGAALPRVAVRLYGTGSTNKLAQTLLELARAGVQADAEVVVFAVTDTPLRHLVAGPLPFAVEVHPTDEDADWALRLGVDSHAFDFVALFESSGRYRGEDLAALFRYLGSSRLDAVWGSRRLSIRDIDEAYRVRPYRSRLIREASRMGSHLLSLTCLVLHGRYISDTLTGVRVVRASGISLLPVPLTHPLVNQYLLADLLGRRADSLEVPVQFLSAPVDGPPVSIGAGLKNLAVMLCLVLAPFKSLTDLLS